MSNDANNRQQAFVDEYLIDFNGTQAAKRAGYSEKTAGAQASRLLKNVKVQKALAEKMQERSERVEVEQDYVLRNIVEVLERCQQRVSPVRDRKGEHVLTDTPDGDEALAYMFDAKNVLKATELLGKHLGMFVEKHEHTGKDGKDLTPSINLTLTK